MARTSVKRPRRFFRRKWLVLLLVVAIAGGVAWAATRPDEPAAKTTGQTATSQATKPGKSKVNLEPPTDEQQNAARDQNSQVPVVNSDGRKAVTPVITEASASEVRAFVNGVIEDGGTCTATYSHGGDVITASSKGLSDAGHTTCGPMRPPGPVNISGDWSVTVTYSSSGYYGKSEAKTFRV